MRCENFNLRLECGVFLRVMTPKIVEIPPSKYITFELFTSMFTTVRTGMLPHLLTSLNDVIVYVFLIVDSSFKLPVIYAI